MSPLFGTTALDAKPAPKGAYGSALCSFTLSVGVQAKNVTVKTRNDYANDPSYVFPQDTQGRVVPDLGDHAVIEAAQATLRRITVRLGKNALEVDVDFYTQAINEPFVIQLAKDALARV